jgi:predicted GTPase
MRRRTSRPPDLHERLVALDAAVTLADGRLEPEAVAAARSLTARAGERLRLSEHHTVAALAGATGSGKSSLFNALSGANLSTVGVTRPTTSKAHACVWGEADAQPLLDWLDVPSRHQLGAGSADRALDGLVLLDLPDHDSTETSHRLEVDRLVELVDLLVWVLDPQKYADAAVHDRYLRPLAGHSAVMLVVLNQLDRLAPPARQACLIDLQRLLADEGLDKVPVIGASVRTGDGLAELRATLVERVAARRAAVERLSADLDRAVDRLSVGCTGSAGAIRPADRSALVEALTGAAGVDTVVRAVDKSHRLRASASTGWPFWRWVRGLRPDPLRRLHLGDRPAEAARTSLPAASPVQAARASAAVRALSDRAAGDLPEPWPQLVRRAAGRDEEALPDLLDRAVAGTDLGVERRPRWWGAANAVQKLLAALTVVGALWLLVLFGFSYLQLPQPPSPHVGRVPIPSLLLLGGVLLGLLLSVIFRRISAVGARRRARLARRRLGERVALVADDHVIAPVQQELGAYDELCSALRRAGPSRGT